MLALKRALSILLSSLLAMPTTTLAKSVPVQVVHQKKLAQKVVWKKRAPAQAEPTKPSKNSKKSKKQAKQKRIARLPIELTKKGAYTVSTEPGRNGRIRSRVVSGKGYREMIVDKNGDGYADEIEVTRGDVTTTASWPYGGRFRRLDVERRMKKGVYKATLLLSPSGKKYQLVSQNVYAYGKFHADAGKVTTNTSSERMPAPAVTTDALKAIMDGATPVRPVNDLETSNDGRLRMCEKPFVIDSMAALDTALRDVLRRNQNNSMENVIKCELDRFQRLMLDQSCYSSPTFSRSIPDIDAGLARVMASFYDPPGGNPGNYVQCLVNQGWTENATKVQEKVWSRFRDMSAAMMLAGLTAQDIARLFESVDLNNCSALDEATIRRITGKSVSFNSIQKQMSTQTTNSFLQCQQGSGNYRAEWDGVNQTITLFDAVSTPQTTPNCRANNCTPADAYASTIFHELVHASGFGTEHEAIVESAEKCCSEMGPNGVHDMNACETTRDSANYIAAIQTNQNLMSQFIPGYNDLTAEINTRFRPYGDRMMGEYSAAMNGTIQRDWPSVQAALRRCEEQAGSSSARGSSSCQSQAFEQLNSDLRSTSDAFFSSASGRCAAYASVVQGGASAATCRDLGTRMDSALFARRLTEKVNEDMASTNFDLQLDNIVPPFNVDQINVNLGDIGVDTVASRLMTSGITFGGSRLSNDGITISNPLTVTQPLTLPKPTSSSDGIDYVVVTPRVNDFRAGSTPDSPDNIQNTGSPQVGSTAGAANEATIAVPRPADQPITIASASPGVQDINVNLDSLNTQIQSQLPSLTPPLTPVATTGSGSSNQSVYGSNAGSFGGVRQPTETTQPSQPVVTTPAATTVSSSGSSATTNSYSPPPASTSGIPMPTYNNSSSYSSSSSSEVSSSNGVASLGNAGCARGDGICNGSELPYNSLATTLNRVATQVNAMGQAVIASTTAQAQAAETNLASTRPAPLPRQPASVDSPSLGSGGSNSPAPANIYTTFAAGPVNTSVSAPVRSGLSENGRRVLSGSADRRGSADRSASGGSSASRREKPSNPDEDEDEDDSSSTTGRRARAAGANPNAPGAKDTADGSEEKAATDDEDGADGARAGTPRNRRAGQPQDRAVASTESAGPAARPSARTRYRAVGDTTSMQRYISRIDYNDMSTYATDREFIQKLRSLGIAIEVNGRRIGAPEPKAGSNASVPVMVPCQSQQRYVLEGTCR